MDLSDKKSPSIGISFHMKKELTFSHKKITNTFKKFFANLKSGLGKELLHPTEKLPSLRQYYNLINFREKNT